MNQITSSAHSFLRKGAIALLAFALFNTPAIANQSIVVPPPPNISSENYILMDALSGVVITGRGVDAHIEPASITKLMTAYVVSQAIRNGQISINDKVTISENAWKTGGSRMFIEVGKTATVEELLTGVAIQSGNDASVALAEFIAGSEEAFAQMMNAEAQRLGMKNTNFVNSTGWPHENHYMSASDIVILSQALIQEFPEHYALYSQKQYTYNDITQFNRNRLLWRDKTVDGIKTGFTESAGYCLVASAQRDGMRLITAVLGVGSDKERMAQSMTLLNFGFRFYTTKLLFHKHEPVNTVRVWGSRDKFAKVGADRDLYVTIPQGGENLLKVSYGLTENLDAPLGRNFKVGELVAHYNDELSFRTSLVTLDEIPQGGWLRRLTDAVIQLF